MRVEQVDSVIVGAGPAGLAAAARLAGLGLKTVVIDEAPAPGGRAPGQAETRDRPSGSVLAGELRAQAERAGAVLHCGLSVWGIFPSWRVLTHPVDPAEQGRPQEIDARTLVVATGATQRPLAIPGWTLPGAIAAGAAQRLLNVEKVRLAGRCAVVGVDPLALEVAHQLGEAGVEVAGVVLPLAGPYAPEPATPRQAVAELARLAPWAPRGLLGMAGNLAGRLTQMTGAAVSLIPKTLSVWGVSLHLRQAAAAITGSEGVQALRIVEVDGTGSPRPDSAEEWPVDTVILSGGLAPLPEAAQLAGCPTVYVPEFHGSVPVYGPDLETPVPGLFVAGSITGVEGREVAAAQGDLAGIGCAAFLGAVTAGQAATLREEAEVGVTAARRVALPFVPQLEAGRARVAEEWGRVAGGSG